MPTETSLLQSHLVLLGVFAAFVATVFATLQRDTPAEQARLAVVLWAGFTGAAIVLGWLMYPLPW